VDWIDLALDRDKSRTLVNTVMNFQVPQNEGISWLVEELARSEEGLFGMELVPLSADLLQTTVVHKGKGKVHPCTGTEALYRPYGL